MLLRFRHAILALLPLAALLIYAGCPRGSATTVVLAATPPASSPSASQSELLPDQVNTRGWTKAWTNLLNDVEQNFTPTLPKLHAVEVQLVLGNPGHSKALLKLSILDSKGRELSVVKKLVAANNCDRVRFLIPYGGLQLNPGENYRIRLSGDETFGWKYIVGGYPNGGATFNGHPLLPDAPSSFLFQTFGSN